jgi:hypothetical protein
MVLSSRPQGRVSDGRHVTVRQPTQQMRVARHVTVRQSNQETRVYIAVDEVASTGLHRDG